MNSDPTDTPSDDDPALQAQQDLLESCLDVVFETYDAARTDGVADPVVLLLDCEDEIGQQIAAGWLGEETVQNAVAEQHLDDESATTVYAQAFPMADCRQEIPELFPYLAPVFTDELPTDGFLAIAVTSGGASAFSVPDSARDS